jgi:AraC-like DNA-binding protein
MVLLEFRPSPFMSEFIRTYRIVHFVFDSAVVVPFKPYPPRPEHCLSFFPKDTETFEYATNKKQINNLNTVLCGQQNELTNRYPSNDFLNFQIVFQPGALYRLTGIPSHELTNTYIDAETIFPKSIKEVNDKLNDAKNYNQMVEIVEAFLLQQINRFSKELHRIDVVSGLILNTTESYNIDWLAKESCLSTRQYERKFIERMGISPKYFSNIAKFEKAYRMKNKFPHLDWLTIAIHCGYYDYQHLSKAYQKFTQKSPTEFHLLDLEAPERKFGESDIY